MTPLRKAILRAEWHNRPPQDIPVQYNPTEITLEKSAQIAEVQIPGLDSPLLQFVRGQNEKLTMDLFFDTTEGGMGPGATSVTTETDKVYQLLKIEPTRHAPPLLTFIWNDRFPGSDVGGAAGAGASAVDREISNATASPQSAVGTALAGAGSTGASAAAAIGPDLGSQRRHGFRCVLESVRQRFTLFSPEGVPLRATLTVSFREYKTLSDQLEQLHLSSPDRTHAHVLQEGDSLASVAHRYYDRPGEWRPVAERNRIDDPRRLRAGDFLEVPRLRDPLGGRRTTGRDATGAPR